MFTPQEIRERTFTKAVFGGYDMQSVDEFLEPLMDDYVTLYKENAVLKSKMKVLVEKLEEYRNQEASARAALVNAQRAADSMIAEARKKSSEILASSQGAAAAAQSGAEEARLNGAKQAAQSFIESVEQQIRRHLELLEELKKQDLTVTPTTAQRQKPFNYEAAEAPLVVPTEPKETAEEIASTIERNLSRSIDVPDPAPAAGSTQTDSSTIKFTNLQFGRNYDPTNH